MEKVLVDVLDTLLLIYFLKNFQETSPPNHSKLVSFRTLHSEFNLEGFKF